MSAKLRLVLAIALFLVTASNGYWLDTPIYINFVLAFLGGYAAGGIGAVAYYDIQDEKEYSR